jgi:hypothetical protein
MAKPKNIQELKGLEYILKELTGVDNWVSFDSSRWQHRWFRSGDKEALVNQNYDWVTVEVNGKTVFSGDIHSLDKALGF